MKIPRIEYEVYYPSNGTTLYKLDINKCHNLNIEIYVPLIIDDEGVDKCNSSSGYYNDICYTCKAVNNSDITLKDRKEEYFYNDMGACEEICNFIDYDYQYNKATCSCKVKEEVKKYSEININITLLISKFKDIKNILNLNTMKCYKKLFSKNGLLYNIGFYITISTIMLHFAISIIFYLIDFALINTIINKIKGNLNEGENKNNDSDKKEIGKEVKEIKSKEDNMENKDKDKDKKIDKEKVIYKKKKKRSRTKKIIQNESSVKSMMNIEEPPIKKIKKTKNINNYSINVIQTGGAKQNDIPPYLNDNSKRSISHSKEDNKEYNFDSYTIYELNNLEYSEALKVDKRNYFEYYLSLLKSKHPLSFSFYYVNDYNSRFIKIYLFFYSFIIYYFVNTLFFSDSTMHKIYIDYGKYNIVYQLPQIIYSSLISIILNFIVKYLALTENSILALKKVPKEIEKAKKDLIKYLYYKFMIFFIVSFLFLLFFWYYISSFCCIYTNTQIHLIKDTLSSFGLSMIYPFGIYLVPGLFRIPALRAAKKDKQTLYMISKIIQIIFV